MYKPKFPKPIRKKKTSKKAKTPEAILQDRVSSVLNLLGIKYLRIPDLVYRLCGWSDRRLKPWEKAQLSLAFKGFPDNVCLMPFGKYVIGVNFELKTTVGKQSAGQRKWARELPVTVIRDVEEAQKAIKELEKYIEGLETPQDDQKGA